MKTKEELRQEIKDLEVAAQKAEEELEMADEKHWRAECALADARNELNDLIAKEAGQ